MYPAHSDLTDLTGSHRFKTIISVGLHFRKPHLLQFNPFSSGSNLLPVTQDIFENLIPEHIFSLGPKQSLNVTSLNN